MGDATSTTSGLAAIQEWLAVAQLVVSAIVGLIVWAYATGRWAKTQEGWPTALAAVREDVDELEKYLREEHATRRRQVDELNAVAGRLDVRVARAEVRIEEHGRRVTVLEGRPQGLGV
jgi:hypothetical protein